MAEFSKTLKQTDIFYQFSPTQLEMVANICQERHYRNGEIVFLESTNSDELYVIAQGEVDIVVNSTLPGNKLTDTGSLEPGKLSKVTIATLRQGQSFGEIALVDQGVRTATACAAQTPTRLLVIPRDKLMLLCDTYPQLGYRLMRNLAADLAQKMRSTDLRIREELLYGARAR